MSVPAFLATSFNFLSTLAVTDVANTITRIGTQLVALGWTSLGGNAYQCPTDSGGHFITLTFTRNSATQLQMQMTDSLSRTITRTTNVPASFTENLYCSTFAFYFDPGNTEGLWASIYDMSPDLQSSHDQFAVMHGFFTSGISDDSTFYHSGGCILDASSPRVYTPTKLVDFITRAGFDGGNYSAHYSQAGSRMWYPCLHAGLNIAGQLRVRGRLQQVLWVSAQEAAGTEISVPLDQSTTGLFKVLGYRVDTNSFGLVMAARKA